MDGNAQKHQNLHSRIRFRRGMLGDHGIFRPVSVQPQVRDPARPNRPLPCILDWDRDCDDIFLRFFEPEIRTAADIAFLFQRRHNLPFPVRIRAYGRTCPDEPLPFRNVPLSCLSRIPILYRERGPCKEPGPGVQPFRECPDAVRSARRPDRWRSLG